MCTVELLGYSVCSVAGTFLGWVDIFVTRTAPDFLLQRGDKFTRQLDEMHSVLLMCAY